MPFKTVLTFQNEDQRKKRDKEMISHRLVVERREIECSNGSRVAHEECACHIAKHIFTEMIEPNEIGHHSDLAPRRHFNAKGSKVDDDCTAVE